ncbi:hypothetical protein EDB92DRAFT_1817293 [Lactarius akahatsu]|uniref:Uncharacterized protein n=1 Tax=Lactarius akahatsu TaxID=416441 RepID=A0AAD4LF28_9AGAM|nr:hypothetical protein EDB92DRAFT_1817293 [Lactarius akahatsu]
MSAVRRLPHTARALALPRRTVLNSWSSGSRFAHWQGEPIRPETDTQHAQRLETAIRLRRTCGVEPGTVDHEEVLLFREKITLPNKLERYPPTIMTGIRLASGAQYEMTEVHCAIHDKLHRPTKGRPTGRLSIASLLFVQFTRRAAPVSVSIVIQMTRDTLQCLGACMKLAWGTNAGTTPSDGGQRKGIFNSYGFGMIEGPAMHILVSPDDRTRKDEARELMPLCRARSVDAASIRDLIPDIEMSNAVVIHGTETQSRRRRLRRRVPPDSLSAYEKLLVGPMWSCPLEGGMTR